MNNDRLMSLIAQYYPQNGIESQNQTYFQILNP